MEAAIEAVRCYNEQALYTARLCEVAIKQLLYCTQIPASYYKKAALGGLLESECRSCKRDGKPRHKNSMLGSLAHRYGLCLQFDGCLIEHLKIVNRKRNVSAAHSETQLIIVKPAAETKRELATQVLGMGSELVHMLQHISDLEDRMMSELERRIEHDTGKSVLVSPRARRPVSRTDSG